MEENQKPQNELSTQTSAPDPETPAPEPAVPETTAPETTAVVAETPTPNPPAAAPRPDASQAAQVTGDNLEAASKKKVYLTAVVVIVMVGIAAAVWYLYGWNKPQAKAPASTPAKSASASPQSAGPSVPSRLLDASVDTNGLAVGYLAKPLASANGNWLAPAANADQASYQAAVFYAKPVSGTNQIFGLDVATKTSSQLTTDANAASDPVFSSVSQNLAYESSYASANSSGGRCDLYAKSLTTGTVTKLASQTTNVCYSPIAWSPDGSKLLYASVDNVLTASDWGLAKLYIYQAGQPAVELKAPTGNNSLEGFADAIWTDANTVEARFENKQQVGGNTLSQQLYSVNTKTLAATPVTSPIDGDLATIQTAGTDQYFATTTPTAAIALVPGSGSGAGTKKVVAGTAGAATYLLQFDAQGNTVSNIVFAAGQAGLQNSMKIQTVTQAGGTAAVAFSPTGYSAYLLGWAGNYHQALYVTVLSGQSDIRLYNFQTKSDSDVVPGLSLVQ